MSLAAFLEYNGYTRIPLSKNGVGHFQTSGFLNERAISVLIDTGAASTIFSFDLGREMNLPMTKLSIFGGGAGSSQLEIHQFQDAHFSLGEVSPNLPTFLAMDLTHVNQALKLKGAAPIEAVLGADILEAYEAVIDYGTSSLYLKI